MSRFQAVCLTIQLVCLAGQLAIFLFMRTLNGFAPGSCEIMETISETECGEPETQTKADICA